MPLEETVPPGWMSFPVAGGAALLIALLLTPLVRRLAVALAPVTVAGGRRASDVPRLGGVVVGAAFAASLLLQAFAAGPSPWSALPWDPVWLVCGLTAIVTVGIADDLRELGPLPKLLMQTAAALMALASGYGFHAVTNPLTGGVIDLGVLSGPISLLWIVGITNAFNLVDGLDGLAAGIGVIVCLTIFAVSLLEGRHDAARIAITLAGALGGFLFFNFQPAAIFLGDSGSLLVGYALSLLSIHSLQKGTTAVVLLVPMLILGLPIIETAVTITRRTLVAGIASVFRADREHIHDRLLALGMNHRRAVLLLYGACAIFGALAFLAVATRGAVDAVIVAVVAAATVVAIRALGYTNRGGDR